MGALVHHHIGEDKLYINAGEYERCAPEWCSFIYLGPQHPVTQEELIGAYHIITVYIRINSKITAIPHLI